MEENHKGKGGIGKKIFRGTVTIVFVSILAKLSAFISTHCI